MINSTHEFKKKLLCPWTHNPWWSNCVLIPFGGEKTCVCVCVCAGYSSVTTRPCECERLFVVCFQILSYQNSSQSHYECTDCTDGFSGNERFCLTQKAATISVMRRDLLRKTLCNHVCCANLLSNAKGSVHWIQQSLGSAFREFVMLTFVGLLSGYNLWLNIRIYVFVRQ